MAPNNTELTSVANDIDKNNVESNDQVDEQVSQLKDWEAPKAQGLYDPQNEHEACGVGFIVAIDGRRNHKVRLLVSLLLPKKITNKRNFFPILSDSSRCSNFI